MTTAELTTAALEVRDVATDDDGRRVLEALCVPYGKPTFAVRLKGYRGEVFNRTAFEGLLRSPQAWPKVRLTDSHVDGIVRRPIAKALEFRSTPEGLLGRWQFFDTPEGRGGWENVKEGTYGGVSVGFIPLSESRTADGLREVLTARLHHVSLVDEPAYREAVILATRARDEYDAERAAADAELIAWARAHRAPLAKSDERDLRAVR